MSCATMSWLKSCKEQICRLRSVGDKSVFHQDVSCRRYIGKDIAIYRLPDFTIYIISARGWIHNPIFVLFCFFGREWSQRIRIEELERLMMAKEGISAKRHRYLLGSKVCSQPFERLSKRSLQNRKESRQISSTTPGRVQCLYNTYIWVLPQRIMSENIFSTELYKLGDADCTVCQALCTLRIKQLPIAIDLRREHGPALVPDGLNRAARFLVPRNDTTTRTVCSRAYLKMEH